MRFHIARRIQLQLCHIGCWSVWLILHSWKFILIYNWCTQWTLVCLEFELIACLDLWNQLFYRILCNWSWLRYIVCRIGFHSLHTPKVSKQGQNICHIWIHLRWFLSLFSCFDWLEVSNFLVEGLMKQNSYLVESNFLKVPPLLWI